MFFIGGGAQASAEVAFGMLYVYLKNFLAIKIQKYFLKNGHNFIKFLDKTT